MSLQVWLPLNGNLNNQGLSGYEMSVSSSPSYTNNGKIGRAISTGAFSLKGNQIDKIFNNTELSISFWVYPHSNTDGGILFGNNSTSTNGGRKFSIYLYPTVNDLHLSWQNGANTDTFIAKVYSGVFPSNQWTHCCVTYKNPNCSIYINGILTGTRSGVSNSSSFTYDTMILNNASNRYVNDLRIYDHCLSAKEVKEISKGLICHYLMNQPEQSPNLSTLPSYIPDFPFGAGTSVFSRSTDGVSRRLTCTTSGTGGLYNTCFSNSVRLENTTYTWSMDVRASKSMPVSIGLEGGGEVNVNLTTDWQRLSKTAVLSTDGYSAFIIYPHDNAAVGDWIEVKLLKVEKNDFATPWSPCSSDYPKWPDNIEYDCSGYRNDGNRVGGILPSESKGRHGISTYCNSTNIGINTTEGAAFIRCTLANPIKNATTLTINWWGNIEDYSFQDSGILSLSNNSSYPIDYETSALAQYDSVFRFNLTDGNYSSVSSLALIETGTWHMYTLVFNNGTVQGYRDGISVISNSKSGTLAQFAYVYIGINAAGRVYRQTKSKWSDFRIYSTALSASDIKELYSTAVSIDSNGTVYAYEFEEE